MVDEWFEYVGLGEDCDVGCLIIFDLCDNWCLEVVVVVVFDGDVFVFGLVGYVCLEGGVLEVGEVVGDGYCVVWCGVVWIVVGVISEC